MRKWLKSRREESGLTMKEMAAKLDISESYYCGIENGTRQKKMDMFVASALAVALGETVETIARLECEYLAATSH